MAVHLPPEALDEWLVAAAEELGLEPEEVSIATVLNVAKHVARGVARPAAPLSTFLMGLALGRASAGQTTAEPGELERLAALLNERAARWDAEHTDPAEPADQADPATA
ncbi:hypothetical protein JOF28_001366 [Leucobacter exalbidus]|uniref:DUF6457 domain-containing protein n=1 Tax=Leucobacter exalbidus TaxID=662960 RepID=A0A940PRB7_9MICO|nr:DUF6457 domain-containing protein [Leucobacter exalbidus]MBP1326134.1 hypothetical protein [Leucobacter exalbidus]